MRISSDSNALDKTLSNIVLAVDGNINSERRFGQSFNLKTSHRNRRPILVRVSTFHFINQCSVRGHKLKNFKSPVLNKNLYPPLISKVKKEILAK